MIDMRHLAVVGVNEPPLDLENLTDGELISVAMRVVTECSSRLATANRTIERTMNR